MISLQIAKDNNWLIQSSKETDIDINDDIYNDNNEEILLALSKKDSKLDNEIDDYNNKNKSKKQIEQAKKELLRLLDQSIYFNDNDKITSTKQQQQHDDMNRNKNAFSNNKRKVNVMTDYNLKSWKKRSSFFVYNPQDK